MICGKCNCILEDCTCPDLFTGEIPMNDQQADASPTATVAIWDNEDGDRFGEGHIDSRAFKVACHAFDVECLGEDHECTIGPNAVSEFDVECSMPMEVGEVRHVWWRPADGYDWDDKEWVAEECEADDPRARPFTVWFRS